MTDGMPPNKHLKCGKGARPVEHAPDSALTHSCLRFYLRIIICIVGYF